MRTESRGVHYRSDYPEINYDKWTKEIIVQQNIDGLLLKSNPVIITEVNPPKGIIPFETALLNI